ncbi:MAG: bifunctional 2-C-methyl-D-erythritol 4-phosphate cytidylyltransferase/2-C-methyl-D-erythritol 2,4-cyclodiphosphate synthase [Parvibaculaceae bacterium]
MRVAALIVAAGRGTRAGDGLPKQYRPVGGQPLLRHCLTAFDAHPRIDQVLTVIHPDDMALFEAAAKDLSSVSAPVFGGSTRQASVLAGLEALAASSPDCVLIHDGARPFVDAALIDRVIEALETHDGALPCLAVTDTLRRDEHGLAGETVDRSGLVRAQTPQGFRFASILTAHRAAPQDSFTDDVALAAASGLTVHLVTGSEDTFKVTEPQDFDRAEQYLLARAETRTGSGFDVHRFCDGDHVTLCGVRIAHTHGLEGHSDADAGLHALTDALLGAIGEGDIGDHFPPSDPQWKGASSHVFLEHAARLLAVRGGRLVHADVTLICETPKIGPHRDAMRKAVAGMLGVDPGRVSVKATTTEGLGFTGRNEGLAAQAIVTVSVPRLDGER